MNIIKPKVIDRKKLLAPEEAARASWRQSPQTVRLWKSKDHARRMMVMGRVIAKGKAAQAKVMDGMARDALLSRHQPPLEMLAAPDEATLRGWLLTPSQAAAIDNIQRLALEIKRLADFINQQNAVFSLGQEMLRLSELSSYMTELNGKVGQSFHAAKKLGVNAVVDDFKTGTELENGKKIKRAA
ncbi:hypothetical protein CRG49_008685 [Neisseria sp. N95_16]|uniref:Uncharacterized protein n=1 Tax=Neisseria brasiliensis TaxID=2666100 RepID=A0A7X2GWF0_9NEIS|nr:MULTISPECIES: hypothetical protein [Neisseria]MRN37226.1 hypothetical protein [Neisseria brasiliensis]PJO09223.1 hypothetical protein CRG49_008685 [Neisseria sp. N95_16]